ncbi:MAG: hypothetical protein JRI23_01580 [Deltaproteobacteria bacterium]|jgi:hypothetical protein|nr:hypothetical protein [Deltaproteobacteria bacterium]MBW2530157.1 hypothetical protein [Deltaproteobacteria bacterium]
MSSRFVALALALGALLVGSAGCAGDGHAPLVSARSLGQMVRIPRLPARDRAEPRADATLKRAGRTTVRGHLMVIPPRFSSADGAYDVVVHFHGNPNAVAESVQRAGINAVLVIVNLGAGATRYVKRFADPGRLRAILRRVDEKLADRGLREPRRRRLALSAWSAGYGGIMRVLGDAATAADVDAVLLLDALHARRLPATRGIDRGDLAPFAAFAKRAAAGKALLLITHSEIEPEGPLVSVDDCSGFLLEQLGVRRVPTVGWVAPTSLDAAHASYAARSLLPLDLASVARQGGLVVRGYEGSTPEHHIAHLFQMEPLALDDLRRWWAPREQPPAV